MLRYTLLMHVIEQHLGKGSTCIELYRSSSPCPALYSVQPVLPLGVEGGRCTCHLKPSVNTMLQTQLYQEPWVCILQGAAELVLRRCTKAISTDGSIIPLNSALRAELEETTTSMAARGLRTLCITYRDFPASANRPADFFETPPDTELICCAITGIKASLCLLNAVHFISLIISGCKIYKMQCQMQLLRLHTYSE